MLFKHMNKFVGLFLLYSNDGNAQLGAAYPQQGYPAYAPAPLAPNYSPAPSYPPPHSSYAPATCPQNLLVSCSPQVSTIFHSN